MIKLTKLKQLREQKGLPQEKFARIADVSNNTVVNIESSKQTNPTIETVSKIAKALEVKIEELFSE